MRSLRLFALAAALIAAPARAQEVAKPTPQAAPSDLVRVFLDCQSHGCDYDFFRTEIAWVNFVRDRTDAQVHVLVTGEMTGSGGHRYTITFDGIGVFANVRDSLTATTKQGDTEDEVRREVVRALSVGLLRYARTTSVADRLQVSARGTAASTRDAGTKGKDKWNLWVFSIRTHMFGNGDDNYRNTNFFGSINADRVSEAWKINLRAGFDYSENRYKLSEGDRAAYQRSSNQNALVVKSLNDHWSAGISMGTETSKYSNYSFALRALPAVEYDVFPYKESTRRQVIVRYGIGVKSFDYDSITIYGKAKETRPAHELVLAGEARQKWGSLSIGLRGSQYLDELARRSASIGGGINWRVVRGLEFNVDGYYEMVRDQLNIPRGDLDDQDILIRLRQLQSGKSYFVSWGLSYTFGSIFNNVVNPRFDR